MTTVYSYLRFSRPEQMKGDSRRRQIQRTREWAERNGHRIDEALSLEDRGVSAFRGKNAKAGALGEFRKAIELGKVRKGDILVLENLDRLSRDDVMDKALPLVREILSAGVSIVTLDPERTYTTESVRELGTMMELMMSLFLANEESRKKSERLAKSWGNKRAKAQEKKLTAIAPMWVTLADDKSAFKLIPERAKIVRRIFRMTAEGAGSRTITKALNAEEIPTFGRGKRKAQFWQHSYVKKVLSNRAVLGEYQPHRMVDGKRVPAGDPIPDYYPRVVDEKTFYAANQAVNQRNRTGGQTGAKVTNLFTGLVRDARDGSPMNVVNKGDGPALVSSAAKCGQVGSVYISFPYASFEQAMVLWGNDLRLADVVPRNGQDVSQERAALEAENADLDFRIAKLEARLRTDRNMDRLLDTLTQWTQESESLQKKIEKCNREESSPISDAAASVKQLIGLLKSAKGQSLIDLRLKLRQHLGRIIQDIVVLVVHVNFDRLALVDILLKNGQRRQLAVSPPRKRIIVPTELVGRDIRTWKDWPKKLRETRFEGMTDEETRILKEFDDGRPRSHIAPCLFLSPKLVTRTLIKYERVPYRRKKFHAEHLMSWNRSNSGWVKRYNTVRYSVGLRELASQYPKLVKEKSQEGSWKAANEWWKAKLKELES